MKHILRYVGTFFLALACAGTLFSTLQPAFAGNVQSNSVASILSERDKPKEAVGKTDVRSAIISVINYFLTFLGLAFVVIIIYAGVMLVLGGTEDQMKKSTKMILYGIIGVVLVFLSWTIVNFVAQLPDTIESGAEISDTY